MRRIPVVKDSVVFITGCNRERGIGRALVVEAAKRGASKIYATARDISQLEDLTSQYRGMIIPLNLDVTDKCQIELISRFAHDTQILINNSGVVGYSGICFNYNEEVARQEIEVNYFGTLNLVRAFTKNLINNKNAAIVNIISIGGLSTFPLTATYCASKASAHSLTQSVRAELAPHNVSVYGVYPGPIDTDMADGVDFEKETPANAAIRIFDGVESGIEDITTDKFSDSFVKRFREDPKSLERDLADFTHKISKNQ